LSQIEKLFEKLTRKPTPADILFDDVDKLLRAYNFKSRQLLIPTLIFQIL